MLLNGNFAHHKGEGERKGEVFTDHLASPDALGSAIRFLVLRWVSLILLSTNAQSFKSKGKEERNEYKI